VEQPPSAVRLQPLSGPIRAPRANPLSDQWKSVQSVFISGKVFAFAFRLPNYQITQLPNPAHSTAI
jgi:hypothetical protein